MPDYSDSEFQHASYVLIRAYIEAYAEWVNRKDNDTHADRQRKDNAMRAAQDELLRWCAQQSEQ